MDIGVFLPIAKGGFIVSKNVPPTWPTPIPTPVSCLPRFPTPWPTPFNPNLNAC